MTTEEMLADLEKRTGETDIDVLTSYLEEAGAAIIEKAFPFVYDTEEVEVPLKYQRRQIEIATYLLNKRGAEGETKHDENGTNRSYEAASIPDSMLRGITPYAKVPKEAVDENP